MKTYLHYFVSKHMKIAYNFYAILRNYHYFPHINFLAYFSSSTKNLKKIIILKQKHQSFALNNNRFSPISNKFADFLGIENTQ